MIIFYLHWSLNTSTLSCTEVKPPNTYSCLIQSLLPFPTVRPSWSPCPAWGRKSQPHFQTRPTVRNRKWPLTNHHWKEVKRTNNLHLLYTSGIKWMDILCHQHFLFKNRRSQHKWRITIFLVVLLVFCIWSVGVFHLYPLLPFCLMFLLSPVYRTPCKFKRHVHASFFKCYLFSRHTLQNIHEE